MNAIAKSVLEENRVGLFIVAYNAQNHIESTIERIPDDLKPLFDQIYVIDDSSTDQTTEVLRSIKMPKNCAPFKVFRTPENLGYGGNQILGYDYALEQGLDIVVLLHGDGQYAPERLPDILAPYAEGADAVFGSRFLRGRPLKGGMPLYKFFSNLFLSYIQNRLTSNELSEWHSGYRSYRTSLLARIPFRKNALDFGFDADIIIQATAAKAKIVEVSVPTFYGNEICHVNGFCYAWHCLKVATKYRLMQIELFYDPRFDIGVDYPYTVKTGRQTTHGFVRTHDWGNAQKVLDVGGGGGESIAQDLSDAGHRVLCVDQFTGGKTPASGKLEFLNANLNDPWPVEAGSRDIVFALDVLEHLTSPETALHESNRVLKSRGLLCASTANVAFLPVRMMLLLGIFNYGRRGILDLTHTRLFTKHSFRRIIENSGYEILKQRGFGPPIRDLVGRNWFLRVIDSILSWLAQVWPGVFAYQLLIIARKRTTIRELSHSTFHSDSSL